MENKLNMVTGILCNTLKNIHLNVSLSGWPATISLASICVSGVAIYWIKSKKSI